MTGEKVRKTGQAGVALADASPGQDTPIENEVGSTWAMCKVLLSSSPVSRDSREGFRKKGIAFDRTVSFEDSTVEQMGPK